MDSVIIIGGGVGGLCTGLRLLHAGFKVTIYEKQPTCGGALTRLTNADKNFTFDLSASLMINPHTYSEIFYDLNLKPENYFTVLPRTTTFRLFSDNALTIDIPQDHYKLPPGYQDFVSKTNKRYALAKKYLLNHPYHTLKDVFNYDVLKALYHTNPLQSADSYLDTYNLPTLFNQLILFQTLFMGISPYSASSIYTSIAAQSQTNGIPHLVGGLSHYKTILEECFQLMGGHICYNKCVSRIVTNGKRAEGILVEDNYVSSDCVVVNTDYAFSQSILLGRKWLRPYSYSCSTFIIHLGLSRKYPSLDVHNLVIPTHFKEEIDLLFKGKLPISPLLYIYSPSCVDTSFTKNPNHSVVNLMLRVPNLYNLKTSWTPKLQEHLYRLCLKQLAKLPGCNAIGQHILYHHMTTPQDFQVHYNYAYGSCFGIAHHRTQSLCFRPQLRDSIYENLYYVGASIHPGNGASIVMDCAKMVSSAISSQFL